MVVQALTRMLYYEQRPPTVRITRLMAALIFIHLLSGELTEAERVAQQGRNMMTKGGSAYAATWLSYLLGCTHYFRNDMEKAAHYFESAVKGKHFLHTRAAVDGLAGLTLTYQALGQSDKVAATMEILLAFAQETNDRSQRPGI